MSGRLQLRGTSLMKSSASSPPPYTSMIATTSTTTSSTKPTTITCAAREADVTSRPYHHPLRLRRDLVRPSPLSLAPPEFEEFRPAAIGSATQCAVNSTRRVGVGQGRGCEGRKLKNLTGNTRGRGSVRATCATSGLCCAVNRAQNPTYRPLV